MHLRRALLLFAVVLALAAAAAALSSGPREEPNVPPRIEPPPQAPGAAVRRRERGTLRLTLRTGGRAVRRRLPAGRHAIVSVSARAPGLVALSGLGLVEPAQPGTPATFDVLVRRPGRLGVTFEPAGGGPVERVATLMVTP